MSEPLRIHCNNCSCQTRHGVRTVFQEFGENLEVISWEVVQCNGCDSLSFYKEHSVENENGEQDKSEHYSYPPRQYRILKQFINAPAILDQLYRETIEAFNGYSFLLCAGGLRALVEGICGDKGITDGPAVDMATGEYLRNKKTNEVIRKTDLQGRIEGLAEKGVLTRQTARVLHEHRYLGNRALHELTVPARSTLETAIEIVEHLMTELYQLEAHAAEIKKAREEAQLHS